MKKKIDETLEDFRTRVALKNAEEEQFYAIIADLFDTVHEYHIPYEKRTRWNTRLLGNGRYPGFGTIQCFGGQIRVILKHPIQTTKMFNTKDEVITFIRNVL